jgi:aspartate 4-decarboxylase
MAATDTEKLDELSPFELKDRLISIASSEADRLMLNAGRGNPNFLATLPRRAFLRIGDFAMQEAERSYSYLDSGFGGMPEKKCVLERFETFGHRHEDAEGIRFINAAISYVDDQLGLDRESFMYELVHAFLGCSYPTPPRMLPLIEKVVAAYLAQEMFGKVPRCGPFSLFATEGGTAAMTYIFQTLKANGLISPGDKVALGTPIFSPYLEIPPLPEYDLGVVDIRMQEESDWQFSAGELAKLEDPAIKIFCLVNPSNPPSTRLSDDDLDMLARLVTEKRPDLFIVTDDVYGTFADDFVSLFAKCPRNTLCVYSFSKYFGATGWRLGVIALHEDNVLDAALAGLGDDVKQRLAKRYSSLTTDPGGLRFIDRLVADSRAVALNHTAGPSTPQQLQMALFALNGLMDRAGHYKNAAKGLVRKRYETLCSHMGITPTEGPDEVHYYTLIDLKTLGRRLFGDAFEAWFERERKGTDFLFRLAKETGVVLLPGKGFEAIDPSVRVSLANLTEAQYKAIGRFTRQVLDEYGTEFAAKS